MSPHDMPRQAQKGEGSIAPAHSQPDTRRWAVSTMLRPLYPQETPGTHCMGDLAGPGASLYGTEDLATHWDLIPGLSSP